MDIFNDVCFYHKVTTQKKKKRKKEKKKERKKQEKSICPKGKVIRKSSFFIGLDSLLCRSLLYDYRLFFPPKERSLTINIRLQFCLAIG